MNSKSTWIWIAIAAALFATVFMVEKFARPQPPDLVALLPNFRAVEVTSVQFAPAGQLEIRAVHTNGTWQLVKPITYPAQAASIETLLLALQKLAPARTISGTEARQRPNADEEFGFNTRTTLTLSAGPQSRQLLLGARTAPGDQLYVQVVGVEGIFVVDAGLLQLLPTRVDYWRDTGLVDLRQMRFDRIAVSNATTTLSLQRESTNSLWRLTYPIQARANNIGLGEALVKLHGTRVKSFVTDDPRSDLENFGFQTPELELTLGQGTNTMAAVQFGRSPTNDSTLVYARRAGFPTVVLVERLALAPWLVPLEKFRDPHLVTLLQPVAEIEIRGAENFVLQRVSTNAWRMVDAELPVDAGFVGEFLLALVKAPITEFKDAITAADLPKYGLTEPTRQILLRPKITNGTTNTVLAELSLGEVKDGIGYVRRTDENPVYAINITDYARLSVLPWQLRDRKIWRFSETNVVRMIVQQRDGRQREVRRLGANSWTFAAGSQGILNGAAVEETVHRFGELDALAWIGHGPEKRAQFGFNTNILTVAFELKDGTKHEVEFGGESPDQYPYAAIKFGEETWFFECPLVVFKLLEFYLLNSATAP